MKWNKLNLGSGKNKKQGYCNIDLTYDADIHLNLEDQTLPFEDNSIEEVVAENLLCMLSNLRNVMNESHRVLINGGVLRLLTFDAGKHPELFFQDPDHKRGLNRHAYDYFIEGTEAYSQFGDTYGYKPWGLLSEREEGSCLLIQLTPIKK